MAQKAIAPRLEQVQHGDIRIPFTLHYRSRRSVTIRVCPNGSVEVSAPRSVPVTSVREMVLRRADWIQNKQQTLNRLPTPLRYHRFEDGEIFHYLGKPYPLMITRDLRNFAELTPDVLQVSVIREKPERVRKLVSDWYRAQAEKLFTERFTACLLRVAPLGICHNGTFRLRQMKSRWGSCSSRGDITLNIELIATPEACIDYVITHELCHLREMNHSKRFYALMDAAMPDWQQHRNWLHGTKIPEKR